MSTPFARRITTRRWRIPSRPVIRLRASPTPPRKRTELNRPHKHRSAKHAAQFREGPAELWAMRDTLRAGEVDWPTKPVVLVDIDGTLSNPQHRLWMIRGHRRKNWDGFFAACDRDPPVEAVVRWTQALAEDRTVVVVSGRPIDKAGAKTLEWMQRYCVP